MSFYEAAQVAVKLNSLPHTVQEKIRASGKPIATVEELDELVRRIYAAESGLLP